MAPADDASEAPTAVVPRKAGARAESPGQRTSLRGTTRPMGSLHEVARRPSPPHDMAPTTWIEAEPTVHAAPQARAVSKTVRVDVAGLGEAVTVRATKPSDMPMVKCFPPTHHTAVGEAPRVEQTDPMRASPLHPPAPAAAVSPTIGWLVAVILGVTSAVVTEIVLILAR